jgi:ATP phosphoribosyltransferase
MAADIVPLAGSVEIAPRMNLADVVADLVDTGDVAGQWLVEVEKIRDISRT